MRCLRPINLSASDYRSKRVAAYLAQQVAAQAEIELVLQLWYSGLDRV